MNLQNRPVSLERGRAKFARWLQTQGRHEVGTVGDLGDNPVTNYLRWANASSGLHICLTPDAYAIGGEIYRMPNWANHLILKVNDIKDSRKVRASRVLRILKTID